MLSLIISTLVFFAAAWYIKRYLDDLEIGTGMTRSVLVFTLATLASFGSGALVNWAVVEVEGPQPASLANGDLTPLLQAIQQAQVQTQP